MSILSKTVTLPVVFVLLSFTSTASFFLAKESYETDIRLLRNTPLVKITYSAGGFGYSVWEDYWDNDTELLILDSEGSIILGKENNTTKVVGSVDDIEKLKLLINNPDSLSDAFVELGTSGCNMATDGTDIRIQIAQTDGGIVQYDTCSFKFRYDSQLLTILRNLTEEDYL